MMSLIRSALCRTRSSELSRCARRFRKPSTLKMPAALKIRQSASLYASPVCFRRTAFSDCINVLRDRLLAQFGAFKYRQPPRGETEHGESKGHDGQRHRDFGPFRDVVNAESRFHAGHTDIEPVGNEPEDYHQRTGIRSEEHTSELQSQSNLVCRLLLEKK